MDEFNYKNASKVGVHDGCIKYIWLEESKITEFDKEDMLELSTGCNAIIEFANGKKMLVSNSEWCFLQWV